MTLPVSLAIKNIKFAEKFRAGKPQDMAYLTNSLNAVLPEAEAYLDRIEKEACKEARRVSRQPQKLLILVEHTRDLSRV